MTIEIKNLEAINKAVEERLRRIEPTFQDAVEQEAEGIKTRTKSGIDVNGKQFVPYSNNEKWAGKNWKDVRKEAGLQTAYVDLTYDGDMFNAMKVVFKKDGFKFLATIFFNDQKQSKKALGHQTGKLGKVKYAARKFFGLSKPQREAIASKLRNAK
jgi:hypothetical protein